MKKCIFIMALILITCGYLIPTEKFASAASPFNIKDGTLVSYNARIKNGDHISIPNGVKIIGEYAFNAYSWGEGKSDRFNEWTMNIPDSVVEIKKCAFYSCEGLTKYEIPSSVTTIGDRAIGFSWNGYVAEESYEYKIDRIEITGAAGSAAERYAKENGFKFTIDQSLAVDKPSTWAVGEINAAIETGIVPAHLQRNYQNSLSRGNVAQMFINLIEKVSEMPINQFLASKGVTINKNAFTDTNDETVLAANALGIINGVGNGKFEPDGTLTRAHVAALLTRVANVLGVKTTGYSHSFTDVGGHWADSELGWPVHVGIINGVGGNRFEPDSPLTTEQVIIAAYRAIIPMSGASTEIETRKVGNTAGNLSNGGVVCEYDNWVFYVHDTGIYRTPSSGGSSERIFEVPSGEVNIRSLNAMEQQLYFTSVYFGNDYKRVRSTYKIKLDGSGYSLLDADLFNITVTDKYIIGQDSGGNIIRVNPDGGNRLTIKGNSGLYDVMARENLKYSYKNGWIYYFTPEGIVYRKNLEALTEEKVSAAGVVLGQNEYSYIYEITCGEDGFYYNEFYGDISCTGIQRINYATGRVETILPGDGWLVNEIDGWIYFQDCVCMDYAAENTVIVNEISRIRTDGTGQQEVCSDDPRSISITKNHIYFEAFAGTNMTMRRAPLAGGASELVMS